MRQRTAFSRKISAGKCHQNNFTFPPSYPPTAEDQSSTSPLFLQWALFLHFWQDWYILSMPGGGGQNAPSCIFLQKAGRKKKPSWAGLKIFSIKSPRLQRLRLTRRHGLGHHPPTKTSGVQESKVKKEDVFSRLCVKRHHAASPQKRKTFLKI